MEKSVSVDTFQFLTGGGEMGALMREKDWSGTVLNNPACWPLQLKQLIATMLVTPSPILICWGKEYTQFYNDDFRPILGINKHPRALGIGADETYGEIWDTIKPLFEKVMQGTPVAFQDFKLMMDRNGYLEEVYFDFSYSPILNENGIVQGIQVICLETTQKVNSLKYLGESEQRFQNLVRDATVGIIVLHGKEMTVGIVNDAYGKLIDRSPDELLGKKLFHIIPDAEAHYRPLIDQVRESGQPLYLYSSPYAVSVGDKTIAGYLNVIYQPYREKDGTITGVMALCQDVTEQVEAQQKIEASEKRFRSLIEEAPVATCLFTGREMKIELANDNMLGFWGKDSSVIGLPLADAVPELKGQPFLKILEGVFNAGEAFSDIEACVQLEVGGVLRTFYINYTYKPLLDEVGEVYGIMKMAVDVTEQVLATKALAESEERFRLMADHSPMFVFIIEPDEHASVSYWNKTWLEYTGQSFQEATGRSWNGIIHPDDVATVLEIYVPAFEKLQSYYIPAVRTRRYDGQYRWYSYKGNPRYSPDGSFNGYVGVGFDVHAQKLAEEKLEILVDERTKQLQRSNDDLLQFAHVASHDLKEPVRKIKTYAHLLQDEAEKNLTEKEGKYVNKILSAAERMSVMIDGVLNFSTISNAEQKNEKIDVKEILLDIENDLEVVISQKSAKIKIGDLPKIEGANVLIYQLFYNLLNNSLKFVKEGTTPNITITSSNIHLAGKSFVKIVFQDNGIGFEQKFASRIFETFARLNAKDSFEGTGLGLALCKKIVDRHHGTIEAQGLMNEGAKFIITLPTEQPRDK